MSLRQRAAELEEVVEIVRCHGEQASSVDCTVVMGDEVAEAGRGDQLLRQLVADQALVSEREEYLAVRRLVRSAASSDAEEGGICRMRRTASDTAAIFAA